MFKNIIKIIIPTILILIIVIIGYNSYKEISVEKENPLSVIPSNTTLIFQLKNLDDIIDRLKESNITKLLMTINNFKEIENHLKRLIVYLNKIVTYLALIILFSFRCIK